MANPHNSKDQVVSSIRRVETMLVNKIDWARDRGYVIRVDTRGDGLLTYPSVQIKAPAKKRNVT